MQSDNHDRIDQPILQMTMEMQVYKYLSNVLKLWKKKNHGERKTTQTVEQCSKTIVDMEEKNTYIY